MGAGYAATTIGTSQLKNDAATTPQDQERRGEHGRAEERRGDLGQAEEHAVNSSKIAGGTITAANIAPGQVVTGKGNFRAETQVLPTTAVDTPVLTVQGVGQLRATCTAPSATAIDLVNASGAAVEVLAWGVIETPAAPVSQQTGLANGVATADISSTVALGLDYQVSFAKAGILQVLTATVSAGPSAAGCIVTASAVSTG